MKKTINEKLRENSRNTIYNEAAQVFGVNLSLVYRIGSGERKAKRGKSRQIKEWLEKRIGA